METERPDKPTNRHLLQVDIMLEDSSPALALATLLQLLNHPKVKDFRITSGMVLGQRIEEALQQSTPTPMPAAFPIAKPTSKPAPKPAAAAPASGTKPRKSEDKPQLRLELLEEYRAQSTLVRLTVVKGKGVKLSIPCRIVNFDASVGQLTIYHDDEKKVYSFGLNEIDDIEAYGRP